MGEGLSMRRERTREIYRLFVGRPQLDIEHPQQITEFVPFEKPRHRINNQKGLTITKMTMANMRSVGTSFIMRQ